MKTIKEQRKILIDEIIHVLKHDGDWVPSSWRVRELHDDHAMCCCQSIKDPGAEGTVRIDFEKVARSWSFFRTTEQMPSKARDTICYRMIDRCFVIGYERGDSDPVHFCPYTGVELIEYDVEVVK